jgi:pseudouridine kinase
MQGRPSPEYVAILAAQSRELVMAVVAMDEAEALMDREAGRMAARAKPGAILFADANLSNRALRDVIMAAQEKHHMLAIDAVSIPKAKRLPQNLEGIGLVFMNADEAAAYLGQSASPAQMTLGLVARGAAAAVVTNGEQGAWCANSTALTHQLAFKTIVEDVTGAGDSLIAATLWRLGKGDTLEAALAYGVLAASLTTESRESVHPSLSPGFLEANHWRIGKK